VLQVYGLLGVVLAVMLGLFVMGSRDNSAQAVEDGYAVQSLYGQAELILNSIRRCVILYPVAGPGTDLSLPAQPASGLVADLACPGDSRAENLWSGTSGTGARRLPVPPSIFGAWQYRRDSSGIAIVVSAVSAAAGNERYREALCGLAERQFGPGTANADLSVTGQLKLVVWLKQAAAPSGPACLR
jgi:hypothetical protein